MTRFTLAIPRRCGPLGLLLLAGSLQRVLRARLTASRGPRGLGDSNRPCAYSRERYINRYRHRRSIYLIAFTSRTVTAPALLPHEDRTKVATAAISLAAS